MKLEFRVLKSKFCKYMYTSYYMNKNMISFVCIQIMFSILVTQIFISVLFGSLYAPYLQPSRYMYILKSV